MRTAKLVFLIVTLSVAALAQQPARPGAKATQPPAASLNPAERQKLHESAMKFVEAADVRHRLSQALDKLLQDGKESMMEKNPGLDPRFGEEWLKRMHERVNLDDFVTATARVYEKYFTADELEELARGQLALKKAQIYSLPPKLADKLKTNSPFVQRDINSETSVFGGRLGADVGKEIEKEHPEWVKPVSASAPAPQK